METWTVELPGLPCMAPVARLFVRCLLTDALCVAEAESITNEFVANALTHTSSGTEGETFLVTVTRTSDLVGIRVSNHSAGKIPHITAARNEDEFGRGLAIVEELATRWGHELGADGTTAWAEIDIGKPKKP